jgi:hypothetical protein
MQQIMQIIDIIMFLGAHSKANQQPHQQSQNQAVCGDRLLHIDSQSQGGRAHEQTQRKCTEGGSKSSCSSSSSGG